MLSQTGEMGGDELLRMLSKLVSKSVFGQNDMYPTHSASFVYFLLTRVPYVLTYTFVLHRTHFQLTLERCIVPLQKYCDPACLLTQSNEAGTNDYPL